MRGCSPCPWPSHPVGTADNFLPHHGAVKPLRTARGCLKNPGFKVLLHRLVSLTLSQGKFNFTLMSVLSLSLSHFFTQRPKTETRRPFWLCAFLCQTQLMSLFREMFLDLVGPRKRVTAFPRPLPSKIVPIAREGLHYEDGNATVTFGSNHISASPRQRGSLGKKETPREPAERKQTLKEGGGFFFKSYSPGGETPPQNCFTSKGNKI